MGDRGARGQRGSSTSAGRKVVVEPALDAAAAEFFGQDPEKLKVLAHPIRLKILKQAQLGEVSAKEAAQDLGEPIGKVSYHVRVLADAGLLERSRQTPRRGAVETHYRAKVSMNIDEDTWSAFGEDLRRPLLAATVQEWFSDMLQAIESGGLELDEAMIANAHFTADDAGLVELRAALDAHYTRLLDIEARIRERLRAAPETSVTEVNIGLAFYEGAHTPAANAPFFARHGGHTFPLIPEYVEPQ